MTVRQQYVTWGTGILIWIYALSGLLSYASFGYVDTATLTHMAWILLPILVVSGLLLYRFRGVGEERAVSTSVTRCDPLQKEREELCVPVKQ